MSSFDNTDSVLRGLYGLAALSAAGTTDSNAFLASTTNPTGANALRGALAPAAPALESTNAFSGPYGLASLSAADRTDKNAFLAWSVPTETNALGGVLVPTRSLLESTNGFLTRRLDEPPPRRRIFISFKIADVWAVHHLRDVAANPTFDIEFFDESVREPFNSVNANYVKRRLRDKIWRTSVTICLVGQQTRHSDWVDFELKESLLKGNRIVAMGLPGRPSAVPFPRLIESQGIPVFAWNLDILKREIQNAPRHPIPVP